jgi:molecular chaperone DnaK (HSP70)
MSLLDSPRDKSWIGCIDFGTALSKVALIKRKATSRLAAGDIVPLAIGARAGVASQNVFLLPSLVYVGDDGVLFGDEAHRAALRGERTGRQPFSSPKQYLSTEELECLDEKLPADVDPTGHYTPRDLLILFLAHLLVQARAAAAIAKVPWPVPLRLARPAWDRARAEAGERTLRKLLLSAFAIADILGDSLSRQGGLPHADAGKALAEIATRKLADTDCHDVFAPTEGSLHATVLEATAVAAGLVRRTGRRVIVVADIGAGTSDFGTFMTGLAGHNVVGEIPAGSHILREAGDHIDMLMTRQVLDQAGIDPNAGRAAAARLRLRQRANKEILFNEGAVSVELNDDVRTLKLDEFLQNRRVQEFTGRLRAKFSAALKTAVDCARQYSPRRDRPVPIEIILTGGGHSLPMVTDLVANPPLSWTYMTHLRDLSHLPSNPDLQAVSRQLAVAIGGAVQDVPLHTAPVQGVRA